MIKYHPSSELLDAFAAGQLPTSMAIALSAHVELCQQCRKHVSAKEEALALAAFEEAETEHEFAAGTLPWDDDLEADMMSAIFDAPEQDEASRIQVARSNEIRVGDKTYTLPRALQRFSDSNWLSFGKVQRARLNLEEGATRASFLHIDEGGSVPAHTHKGYELTLLLDGTFEDESGQYSPGDFILLDSRHHHTPSTKDGCLCYTVANAPLHFTKGVSKLLNTVGHAIY
ncbi:MULTISPECIES: ChrR family anti-sigma-E factor [Salinivibrio]|uniref:ChrR family anti-sigma-E factor n=1 Tax=Salinivibrio TaxID=51366 RepID=UPI0009890A2B|nr:MULTISPECIES: ChrR family anti-sigma-E factor [Salinivibrio]OOF15339.1 transcriptional regulator [Salinivibrio sp. PR932]OOF32134.1 transcriptional regulator [Salinivibrio proteolyticus]